MRLVDNFKLRFIRSTTVRPIALAVVVGLLSGLGSVVLRWLIGAANDVFFTHLGAVVHDFGLPPQLHTVVAPALGMVIVAWMTRNWAPEARGHGVPEVQYAERMKGGRIRPRVAVVKAVASAISIGSGGSLGREGPIVQIGSSLGSTLGQVLGLGVEEIRVLVAAGSGAAIGAAFNAPIGGVLFAMEVILGSFTTRSFGLVVVASVSATAVAQYAFGAQPAFRLLEQFTLVSDWEFLFYLILGAICGLVALLYIRSVYGFEALFEEWNAKDWIKALAGGLAVGLIGTFGSQSIFGIGHEGVELALVGQITTAAMLGLVLLKILATSITLGAGGSGGVFAPALFAGAMTGGAFGKLMGSLAPAVTAPSGAYALVGAAAVFGAATHAPLTGIVLLFEMTGNYRIILPLMFSVVLAQLIASRLYPYSIYSVKLRQLGGLFGIHPERGTLDFLLVADAMMDRIPSVHAAMKLKELMELARAHPDTRSWVVLDPGGKLAGMVSLKDVEKAILKGDVDEWRVIDIMTTGVVTCLPGETLGEAFERFGEFDVFQIPVVDPAEPGTVVGMLRRREMLWAFRQLSDEHQRLLDHSDVLKEGMGEGPAYAELPVRPEHRGVCHKQIRELQLPSHTLVALLRRGERVVVPRGFTRIEAGDILTLITTPDRQRNLDEWIASLYEAHAEVGTGS